MPSELTQWLLPSVPISAPLILAALFIMALLGMGILADIVLVAYCMQHPPRWRERVERIRERSWDWRETGFILLVLAAIYVTMGIIAALIHRIYPSTPQDAAVVFLVLQGIVLYASAFALVLFFMRARRTTWQDSFGLDLSLFPLRLGQGLLFYVATMPLLVILSLAYVHLLKHFGIPIEKQDAARLFTDPRFPSAVKLYMALIVVVVAPFVEELVFRGLLLASLRRHARTGLAVVAASLLFAAIHFHLPGIVPLAVIAAAFALAYMYTGSILVPAVMHAAFNAVSVVLMILTKDVPLLEAIY